MKRKNILIILSDEQRYDTLGCSENTVTSYSAPQFPMIGSHGLFHKGHPMHYEETNRIAFILGHPDYQGGTTVKDFASLMSILPTMAEMNNVKLERELERFSFFHLMDYPNGQPEK